MTTENTSDLSAAIHPFSSEIMGGISDTISAPCSVPRELLEALLDNTYELRSSRNWWKDEPRCDYQQDYQKYCEEIAQAEKILKRSQGQANGLEELAKERDRSRAAAERWRKIVSAEPTTVQSAAKPIDCD